MSATLRRDGVWLPAALLVAVLFGAMVVKAPLIAVALVAVAAVVVFAFLAPTAHLIALIFFTALVPFGLQNQFGIGGGEGAPGLLASDALLMTGLLRAGVVLISRPPDRRRVAVGALMLAFLGIALLQFAHGISLGRPPSEVGFEARIAISFGTFLIAIPLLDDPGSRERLLKALLGVAICLGLWGIVQWSVDLGFAAQGDVGVRSGVRLTSEGKGQVQGGLYAFPVAASILYAVLISGRAISSRARSLVALALALNLISLLLTFERSFWIGAAVALAFVTLKAGRMQRGKVFLAAPVVVFLSFAALSTFAPDEFQTARERLLSVGQYGSDNSLRYRILESQHVVDAIDAHPLAGSGYGAKIYWGRPYEQVLPDSYAYTHNGYLWLAWKIGIPGALLLLGLLGWAITRRAPPRGSEAYHAVRDGCQGGLLVLLIASVTFPSFNTLGITPAIGLLLAIATAPPLSPESGRSRSGADLPPSPARAAWR